MGSRNFYWIYLTIFIKYFLCLTSARIILGSPLNRSNKTVKNIFQFRVLYWDFVLPVGLHLFIPLSIIQECSKLCNSLFCESLFREPTDIFSKELSKYHQSNDNLKALGILNMHSHCRCSIRLFMDPIFQHLLKAFAHSNSSKWSSICLYFWVYTNTVIF